MLSPVEFTAKQCGSTTSFERPSSGVHVTYFIVFDAIDMRSGRPDESSDVRLYSECLMLDW